MKMGLRQIFGWRFPRLAVPLVMLVLGLSGVVWGQAKVDVARSEWMKGYVKLEQADKALQEANKLAGLQLYREAVAVFQEVRRKYPQWNPSLLNYRLNYCQQKIKQLEEELQGEATTMDRDKLLELTARQAKLLHENAEQIRELNTTIGILNEAIRRARTEAATVSASDSELQGLRESRGKLEDQCRLLELKMGKAQEEIEGLRKRLPDKDAGVLRNELKQATGQLKELQGQLSDQQKKLQASSTELGRSQAEVVRLQKDQKEQAERLAAASQRTKELSDAGNDLHGRLKAAQLRGDQQEVEIRLHKESLQRLDREKQEMQAEMVTLRGFRDKYILSQESSRQLNERLGELENRLRERDEVVKFAEQASVAGKLAAETLQTENARLQQELAAKSRLSETLELDRRRIMQEMQQQLARERQGWREKELAVAAERQVWQEKEQAVAAERQVWQEKEQAVAAERQVWQEKEQAVAAERQVWQEKEQAVAAERQGWQEKERAVAVERQGWQEKERAVAVERQDWQEKERIFAAERQGWQEKERAVAAERQGWQEKERIFAAERQGWQEKERAVAAERQDWQERERVWREQAVPLPVSGEAGQGSALAAELLRLRQEHADALAREKLLREQLATGQRGAADLVRLTSALAQERLEKGAVSEVAGRLQQELEQARQEKGAVSEIAGRLQQELEQARQEKGAVSEIAGRLQQELAQARQEKGTVSEDAGRLQQELAQARQEKGAVSEVVVRLQQELAQARQEKGTVSEVVGRLQQELAQARQEKGTVSEVVGRLQQELDEQRGKVAGLSERGVRQAERIEAMTAELQANAVAYQRDLSSVQRDLHASRQTLADTLQANQRLESQLQPLRDGQKELVALAQVLKEREGALAERNAELQRQAESLAAANALVLARQDAAQSAQAELQAMRRKNSQLETQHVQLNEQLQALQRRYGDFEKNSGEVRGMLATSQQREQELQGALQDLKLQLEARTQLAVKLEKAVADLERAKGEAAEQVKKEGSLRQQLAEELNRARSKSEAVDGITSNYLELQASLAASGRDLQALRQQTQAGQAEISTLRVQLARRDEQIRQLHERSNTDVSKAEQLWLTRLAELNSKLESEENRRKALELALIQRESAESGGVAAASVPVQAARPESQEMGKYLREQEVVLQGFLRQGVEAERNRKVEAARWNYSRVLELQPDNLLALKRLGLLAANHGDDQGAVNYLKQAFRRDPDDQDILLALGYAMVSLGQPEWALANLGRAMALNPDNATISRLFGVALVNMGWTQAAEQQFVRTLSLAPKDPEAAFNLAVLCLTAQPSRLGEARKWYDQAVSHGAERDPRLEEAFR